TAGSIPCGTSQVDPNVLRPFDIAYNIGGQHELFPRVSVTANFIRTNFSNLSLVVNTQQSFSDYSPFTLASPVDGQPIAWYNVSAAKVSAVQNLMTTDPRGARWNNALEFGFSARLPRGATLFGGLASDKTILRQCDGFTNPQLLLYCDQTGNGI